MSWIARPLCMLYGGHSYGRYEDVFTCRKCLLEAAAQANLVLAYRRLALVRLRADRATPLSKEMA